jgi:hypothetical protein
MMIAPQTSSDRGDAPCASPSYGRAMDALQQNRTEPHTAAADARAIAIEAYVYLYPLVTVL